MKNLFMILSVAVLFSVSAHADDRPVDFAKLPSSAREFVKMHFPDIEVTYATVDDDFIRPDYKVRLANGVKIDFEHNGKLEKIECKGFSVPSAIVPVQITDYVKSHYPEAYVVEYEVEKHSYEVKLSNRIELKFSSSFHLIEIDD